MSEPVRRCVGCGRRAPQRELIRFVAASGTLIEGARAPGRGAYTCRRRECFDRAVRSRGFPRVLHTAVTVDPALAHLYTGLPDGKRR